MKRGRIDAAWKGLAQCQDCGIRDLVLFADLTEPDFNLIHLPIDEIEFDTGAVIYSEDEDASALFTIRTGLVKLIQHLPDGSQRIVRLLRHGATAGLEATLGQPYQHTAVALQPILTCRIPRQVVDRLNKETPRLHGQLMRRWYSAVQQADDWLTELSTGKAPQRLARLLLQLSDTSDTVMLFSREDLGSILGITTEHASRTVAEFRRAGLLVEVGPNTFRCDRRQLDAVASGPA
ncbi:MAG: Crp/Fnr family transcriptional regulator [Hyphomicrobiales bacterium]